VTLEVSTCNPGTDFDTRIVLYQSDTCNSCYCASCIASNDDVIKDVATCSTVLYNAQEASTDWSMTLLFITSSQKSYGILGNYNISIKALPRVAPPAGITRLGLTCEEAPLVPVPFNLSTNNFNSIASARTCSVASTSWSTRRGLWFKFGGTGSHVTAHSCPMYGLLTTIYGYATQSNCSTCDCISACTVFSSSFYTNRGCGQIIFYDTQIGANYYIWVGSSSATSATGAFSVHVVPGLFLPFSPAPVDSSAPYSLVDSTPASMEPSLSNKEINICYVSPINISSIPLEGTPSYLFANNYFTVPDCGISKYDKGAWYKYSAQVTEELIATTCDPANKELDTAIALFADTCSLRSCCAECLQSNDDITSLSGADDPRRLDWCPNSTSYINFVAKAGTTYYFYVKSTLSVSSLAKITFRILRAVDYTPDAIAARQRLSVGLGVGIPVGIVILIILIVVLVCVRKRLVSTEAPRAVPPDRVKAEISSDSDGENPQARKGDEKKGKQVPAKR
jgi:hypothetical protein